MLGFAPLGFYPLGWSGIIVASAGASAVAETGAAAETQAGALLAAAARSEAGSATDSAANVNLAAAARAESGSATDSAANTGQLVGAVAEAGSATDTPTNVGTLVADRAEFGSAADAETATNLAVAATTENGAASDAASNTGQIGAAKAETGSASDVVANTGTLVASTAEAGGANDAVGNTGVLVASVAESGAAVDSTTGVAVPSGVPTAEAGSASDGSSATGALGGYVAEPNFVAIAFQLGVTALGFAGYFPVAADRVSNTAIMVAARAETGTAADAPLGTIYTALQSVQETGAAVDAVSVYKGVLQENTGSAQDAIDVGVLSTGPFTATVAALLKGDTVTACYGVLFNFTSGPSAVWQGIGPLDARLYGGPIFQGIGNFGKVGSVELGLVNATGAMNFELSGLDVTFASLAHNQAAEIKGKRCALFVLVFNADGILIEVRKRRTFVMDKMLTKITADTFSLSLSCEPILAVKSRAPFGLLTDQDQRRRYPSDRGLERVQVLTQKQTLTF